MINTKTVLSLLLIFNSLSLFAFKTEKCTRSIGKVRMYGFLSSTTSYVSSTGECTMIGKAEAEEKLFISVNHDLILQNVVAGIGDYIDTHTLLSGCPELVRKYFFSIKRNEYLSYLKINTPTPVNSFSKIEEIVRSDTSLKTWTEPFGLDAPTSFS